MTQSIDMVIGPNLSGASFRAELNTQLKALLTNNKGATEPSYKEAGTFWADDSASPSIVLKWYSGTTWITVGVLNITTNTFTPANSASIDGSSNFGSDTGGDDAYVITNPALGTPIVGTVINFMVTTRSTGPASLSVNGGAALFIRKPGGFDLADNDIRANQIVSVVYTGSFYQLLNTADNNPQSSFVSATGTANTITLALSPPWTAYRNGVPVVFKAIASNTGAVTVNVNGLGPKALKKNILDDLAANDIKTNQMVTIVYDGTNFQMAGSASSSLNYALLQEEQPSGSQPDTSNLAALTWFPRSLNIVKSDSGSIIQSLTARRFTLGAGKYIIKGSAPARRSDSHQCRLFNVTDNVVQNSDLYGTSVFSGNVSGVGDSITSMAGEFSISAAKTFEFQHYIQTVGVGDIGRPVGSGGVEVYSRLEIWKVG